MSSPVQPAFVPGLGVSYSPDHIPAPDSAAPPASVAPVTPQAPAPSAPVAPSAPALVGDNIPPELQGRTLDEAMAIYKTLRSEHLARFPSPMPAPAPVREVPAAQPKPHDPTAFWTNPEERIAAIVDQRVQAALAPIQANSVQSAARTARDQVAERFGDGYLAIEGKVLEKLQNLDPNLLADPNAWANAYFLAAGEAAVTGRPVAPMPAPTPTPVVNTTPRADATFRPTTFFTEPGRSATAVVGSEQVSDAERAVAQKMGMPIDKYVAWRGGTGGQK